MLKLKASEKMNFKNEGKVFDFDRYEIEVKSQLSTKEYTVIVDFIENEITGDVIAFGGWYDIETEECIELLEEVLKDNKPLRNFSHILDKQI